jgi:hypothetical protein
MSALGLKVDLQNQESAVEPNWRNTRQELAMDEQRRQGLGYVFPRFSDKVYQPVDFIKSLVVCV